uniref:Uncharacterized protein n=1 Tax=Rhizophora mucronata TaxID=61149 RepID=A0A2P2NXY5_RHIMU
MISFNDKLTLKSPNFSILYYSNLINYKD